MGDETNSQIKVVSGPAGYVLEDTYPNPLRSNPAYSVVKQYFVHVDDSVPQKIVVHKESPRGIHFRRAGPRQKVCSVVSDEVHACIVTCGGLCPGLNTVIRELVCSLYHMYGATKVLGIDGGYRGFYSRNSITLTPKVVNDIHKRGGTIIGTSRGGHDTSKIVDSIQDRGINQFSISVTDSACNIFHTENGKCLLMVQVYIIGGDGTLKGAAAIFQEVRRRGLKVAVVGIPKTIDNDIPGGLFEYVEKTLKENGHMVIVIAEGAGQEFLSGSLQPGEERDPSGNRQLQDVGLWISNRIKRITERQNKVVITDRMWARLLSSTNQPSFLGPKEMAEAIKEEEPPTSLLDGENCQDAHSGKPPDEIEHSNTC
ncbi:hypothetical protein TEA_021937 [Camellia sinensis var. sinensis]|uniref:Phosphofructokinase domain-containing protein n=1 Tax=Camellia sinensis var. sinensis TaxID=542762 RepID=A0A4V3WK12_CAMSN|nr:hypothetical protein TEA_021937 [Camellia sinensis var. sinensis]